MAPAAPPTACWLRAAPALGQQGQQGQCQMRVPCARLLVLFEDFHYIIIGAQFVFQALAEIATLYGCRDSLEVLLRAGAAVTPQVGEGRAGGHATGWGRRLVRRFSWASAQRALPYLEPVWGQRRLQHWHQSHCCPLSDVRPLVGLLSAGSLSRSPRLPMRT